MLPPEIRNAGEITVATDADYPPFEFLGTDGKTMTGLSADLMQAALTVLGLKPNVKIVSFESLIPGFAAGRWQVSLAAVSVTPERSQVVDFVTYMQDGTAFYQSAKNSLDLPASYSALEGHTVAVQSGSAEATAAHAAAIGKNAKVLEFSLQSAVNLAVQTGRADFGIGTSPTVGYLIKSVPGFKLAAPPFNFTNVSGFALAKDSGMAEPLRAALAYLEKNGTYQQIFKKWGEELCMRAPKVVTGQ
jgi:polar amino acid transport system substrate-binding protein